jgi:hypothetical protein
LELSIEEEKNNSNDLTSKINNYLKENKKLLKKSKKL